jgi:hypothetical protein
MFRKVERSTNHRIKQNNPDSERKMLYFSYVMKVGHKKKHDHNGGTCRGVDK